MQHSLARTLFLLSIWAAPAYTALAAEPRPNLVFILIDDLGYNDVGCYGGTLAETPNIDRLASQGMRFTEGYAAAPICSPTRASILTGKYPARLHLTNFLKGTRQRDNSPIIPPRQWADQMELDELSIAEVLRSAGYATGYFGKWHLGGQAYGPEHQGFDVAFAGTVRITPQGEYPSDRLTAAAIKFIEANQAGPFFVMLSHYAVHIPFEPKPEKVARYREKLKRNPPKANGQSNPIYAAMVESADDSVGEVMAALERLGLDERTVVIFTSDNGGLVSREGPDTPATSLAPLRAGKGYLYEGGLRVPWIVKWPGVTGAESECSVPVVSNDFFPTLAEIAEARIASANDGVSLVPLLKDPDATLDRRTIYWHYPHFSNQGGRPGGVVRFGRFKLIERYERGELELYDLKQDLGEQNNLAEKLQKQAAELKRMLGDWRQATGAQMPEPNPNYRP